MNELVTFNEKYNCGTTTSLDIAENFNRQHKTILAAINNLEVSSDFIEQNFLPYSYIAKNGKSNPAYEITFDGFTLLAMGFTGKKAMEFKVKYIKAFRAMEAKLKSLSAPISKAVTVAEHTRSLPSGKKEIVLSEKAKTEIGGIVKSCMAAAIREELADLLDFTQVKGQELSDSNLIYLLYRWHSTKSEVDLKKFQQVTSENQALKIKLAKIKQAVA